MNTLIQKLDNNDPQRNWLQVLAVLDPLGAADALQLQLATGFSRDQINRILKQFENHQPQHTPILRRATERLSKTTWRTRPPAVWLLDKTGAALLRHTRRWPDAHPCQLETPGKITHALCSLDIRLAALAAGLDVQTERQLPFGQGSVIRPDNLITLPDGTRALFETEQDASPDLLRRILDGLRNKADFFRNPRTVSPTVRVLFNLRRNRQWDTTIATWERALAIVAQERGGRLPFRLLALPLTDFLAQPDWTEPPDADRWEDLFDPAKLPGFGAPADKMQADVPSARVTQAVRNVAANLSLPAELNRAAHLDNDRLILRAYWQVFQERAAASFTQPDPAFFELITLIYAASHDDVDLLPPLAQAALPAASLYLLNRYLALHPDLRAALNKAISRGSGSTKWSIPTIMNRMQQIIRIFLKYHGLSPDGPLRVTAGLVPLDSDMPRDFCVWVSIRKPELLMSERDGVVPDRPQVRRVEDALAWTLWALFVYAEDVGLKYLPFW